MRKTLHLLLTLLLIIFCFPVHGQTTYHVKTTANGGDDTNDGLGWNTAFANLQTAINTATAGDQIWVAAGTYQPTENPFAAGTDDRQKTFALNKDLQIYGGFAGTENLLSERNPATNVTILDGNNRYHVFIMLDLTNATVLDGFTIQGGNGDITNTDVYEGNNYRRHRGGGLAMIKSSPTINNCIFKNNAAQEGSGIFMANQSKPVLTNCLLHHNTDPSGTTANNAAVYLVGSTPQFFNCTIVDNVNGIYSHATSFAPEFKNTIIYGNGENIIVRANSLAPLLAYCLVENSGGSDNWSIPDADDEGGNIDRHPDFTDRSNEDYSLSYCSAAVGAGNNNTTEATLDLAHQPRIFDTNVDIGAYESQAALATINFSTPTISHATCPSRLGDITVNATSPNGTLEYSIDNGQTYHSSPTFSNLASGRLLIWVRLKDNPNCEYAYPTPVRINAACCDYAGGIIYVNHAATGNDDGSSWADAFTTLQDALAVDCAGAQIWVAAGTYYPDEGAGQTDNDRNASFIMKIDLEIYGGFVGNEPADFDLKQRKIQLHSTILSGDIDQNDQTGGDNSGNSQHIIFNDNNGLDQSSVLDGFTITAGKTDGDGAGVYNRGASPLFINCTLSHNVANSGGGSYNNNSASLWVNCIFVGNQSFSTGSAMYNTAASSPVLTNCTIEGNRHNRTGATIYSHYSGNNTSQCILQNSILWHNIGYLNSTHRNFTSKFSLIQFHGGFFSGRNTANDPLFVQESNFFDPSITPDFRLQVCSPFLNGGSDRVTIDDTEFGPTIADIGIDAAGNPRLFNDDRIDLGAYEFQGTPNPNTYAGDIIYVNQAVSGGQQNGTSWVNAYSTLQDALVNTCQTNATQIWIAKGTYYPDEGGGKANNDRVAFFQLQNGIQVIGGLQGNESPDYDLTTRDFTANATILSGNIDQNSESYTDLIFTGIENNSYHLFNHTNSNLDETAILDGCTLMAVAPDGLYETNYVGGGAMYNEEASPAIYNCVFTNNWTLWRGAGFFCRSGIARLSNCDFINNRAEDGGAGAVIGWTFSNRGEGSGLLTNCTFRNNIGSFYHGAYGGAINAKFPFTAVNCLFTGNQVLNEELDGLDEPTTDTRKLGGFSHGGAIYLRQNPNATFINCTIEGNNATQGAGGIQAAGSSISLINTIVWNNKGELDEIGTAGANMINFTDFNASHSLLQGYHPTGTGNLDGTSNKIDPLFVTESTFAADYQITTSDLRLQQCSPLINQGDNTANSEAIDVASNQRIQENTIDMGSYEQLLDEQKPVPVIANLPTITGQCSATVTAPAPKANDNCAGEITATTSDPLTYSQQGTHTITWTYNDGNGNIATQTQHVIVSNNSTLSVANAPLVIVENNINSTTTIQLTRTNAACAVSVNYRTVDGSAIADTHYNSTSGTINFAANQTTATIDIPIIGDPQSEADKDFKLLFENPTNGLQLADNETTITITDRIADNTVLHFDGIDDQLTIDNLNLSTGFTLEFWIKYAGRQQTQEAIFSHNNDELILGFENGKLGVLGMNLTMNSLFPTNVWKHVVLTVNSNGVVGSLLVDGVVVAGELPLRPRPTFGAATAHFGKSTNQTGFNGSLDEVRMWNGVRSFTEISNSMECEMTGAEDGLALYFNFDDATANSDNTAMNATQDLGTNAYSGQLSQFDLIGTQSNFISDDLVFTNICGAPALAVEWLDFSAKVIDNQYVALDWQVANENATSHYEVERSADGKTFETIGKVAANGDLNYQFVDKNPLRGDNFYRIREVENSGRFSFSETKLVNLKSATTTLLVYPNPTADKINLQLPLEETEDAIFTLIDIHGKTILQQHWSPELDLSKLASGVYLLRVKTADGDYQQRIVKQ